MDAQTTTATVPPSVSYLQPPHAAAHHDTSLPIEKLQPEDPEKGRSHVSKYKQVAFHAIISFSRRLHCSPSSPKVIHYRLVWCKQSTDPTRRPPRAFPQKTRKPGPAHFTPTAKNPVSTSHRSVLTAPTQGTAWKHHIFNPPLRRHSSRSFPKAILASLTADDNLQPDIHTPDTYF